MKQSIRTTFAEMFHADNDKAVCYIDFFQHLHKGDYNNTNITRDAVILNLTTLLLSTWTITPSTIDVRNDKLKLFEEAFEYFDLTVLPNCHRAFIEINWSYSFLEENDENIELVGEMKLLKKNENFNEKRPISLACLLKEKPLFLDFTSESQELICKVVILLKTLINFEIKLVLVNQDVQEKQLPESCRIFQSLKDLRDTNFYEELIEVIIVSLQGRKTTSLAILHREYHLNFDDILTPNELFKCLTSTLEIGQKVENLPEPDLYMKPNVRKREVSLNQLKALCAENTTVIHYKSHLNQLKQFLRRKGFQIGVPNTTRQINKFTPILILTQEPQITTDQEPFYHLKVNSENSMELEWMEESTCGENWPNILYGEPGIGKTTAIKHLALECSPEYWIVIVPLQQINFASENCIEKFVQLSIKNDLDRQFAQYYLEKKKVMFLFDGLHELDSDSIVQAIDVIEKIVKEGHKIWISSTTYVKRFEEGVFKESFHYELQGLSKEQQEEYVVKKLTSAELKKENIDHIIKSLFTESNVNLDILKIPLLLYLLTEILKSQEKFTKAKESFTLIQMYASFLDGQIQHNLKKIKCSEQCNTLDKINIIIQVFKDYWFRECQMAALQTCLEQELLQSFNFKVRPNFAKYVKEGGNLLSFIEIYNNDKYVFSHYSFAQYFVAIWLSENFREIPLNKRDFILKPEYIGIRRFFDAKLAENCPLHLAILEQDMDRVKKYEKECWNNTDKAGRSPLHLAVSIESKHPLLNEKGAKSEYNIISDQKNKTVDEILIYLLCRAKSEDLLKTDEFLESNLFEYADASLCLFSLEVLSKKEKLQWNYLKTTNEQLLTLIYYAVTQGYINLLECAIAEKTLPVLNEQYKEKPLLHLALESNQKKVATLLIKNGADLEQCDSQGQTPLHQAAIWGQTEIVQLLFLLDEDIKIEAKDCLGISPLHLAARMGHKDIVMLLTEKGAKVNSTDDEKRTPLHKAAYLGRTEVLDYLIHKGGNVNAADVNKQTPLHRAADIGYYETVECLVKRGADKNATDRYRKSALHHACFGGHLKIVGYLIGQNVDVTGVDENDKTAKQIAEDKGFSEIVNILAKAEKEHTPYTVTSDSQKSKLHDAAQRGDMKIIEQLVDNGANIEETNHNLETALHIACREGSLQLTKYLLSKGASTAATNSDGQVPLLYACERGHVDIVKELLGKGQDNTADRWGNLPLHSASYRGHKKVVELLLDNGVVLNCEANETVLHVAAHGGNIDVIECLISRGADIGKTNKKNETCLHVAVLRGCTEAVEYLLEKEETLVNKVDYLEQTALHLAVIKGFKNMVQILLDHGADVNKVDKFQDTALDIARKEGRQTIETILCSKSSSP